MNFLFHYIQLLVYRYIKAKLDSSGKLKWSINSFRWQWAYNYKWSFDPTGPWIVQDSWTLRLITCQNCVHPSFTQKACPSEYLYIPGGNNLSLPQNVICSHSCVTLQVSRPCKQALNLLLASSVLVPELTQAFFAHLQWLRKLLPSSCWLGLQLATGASNRKVDTFMLGNCQGKGNWWVL